MRSAPSRRSPARFWWCLLPIVCWLAAGGVALAAGVPPATDGSGWGPVENHPLFRQACRAVPERAAFARRMGARCFPTPDGRSFCLLWYPPVGNPAAGRPARPPMIATLSGHGSWAFDEFFLWQAAAAARGYGIVALQWWLGTGEGPDDYYRPHHSSRIPNQVLRREGVPAGRTLLHGFSRGSANIYGVTALDRHTGNRFFLATVANAGKAGADFPVNREIERGRFGASPFAGTHWILYGGGRDPHPDRDGIPGMREAAAWVTRLGGTVDLFLADEEGDHGGFHRRPQNMEAALQVFDRLLASTTPNLPDR